MPRRFAVFAALAALSACGGGSATGTDNNNNTAACAVTISGAVTASGNCAVDVRQVFSANQTVFTVSIPGGLTGVTALNVVMVLNAGPGVPGAYTELNALSTSVSLFVGSQNWLTARNLVGIATQGTASLTLTGLGTTTGGEGADKVYVGAHGIFDATAPFKLGSGATGTANVHVIF